MSSLLQDFMDNASVMLKDVGNSAVKGVGDIAATNIKNAVTNATQKATQKTAAPGGSAPITTGEDANGRTLAPGITSPAGGSGGNNMQTLALVIGGISALAAVVGVVVMLMKD